MFHAVTICLQRYALKRISKPVGQKLSKTSWA